MIAAGGPALLFNRRPRRRASRWSPTCSAPRGAPSWPSASGPFRLIRRLGGAGRGAAAADPGQALGQRATWPARRCAGRPQAPAQRAGDRGRDRATCDLDRLPALTTWPEDGGPFVTLPLVYTEHPEDRRPQPRHVPAAGPRRRARPACTGRSARAAASTTRWPRSAASRCRSTVFLGGPPALILAAIAPLPENVPELMLASLIAGGKLPVVRGPGRPSAARPTAEFALIGDVPPGERRPEGPFGDHYGYYSLTPRLPGASRSSALLRRRDAIFPATVVGKPRQEDFFIGDLPAGAAVAAVPAGHARRSSDLWSLRRDRLPLAGRRRSCKQRYKREAMAQRLPHPRRGPALADQVPAGHRPARSTCATSARRSTHVLARTDSETDLFVFANLSMDTLDYTGPQVNEGSKGVWLGLGEPVRELPRRVRGRAAGGRRARSRSSARGAWSSAGPAFADEPEAAARAGRATPAFADWPLVVLTDEPQRAARSADQLPLDHLHALRAGGRHPRRRRASCVRNHLVLHGRRS